MRETQDGARKLLAASGRITAPEITRAWERLTAGVLPAAHARGSGLAHAAAGRPRTRQRRSAGRACKSRSERGTTAILAFAPHRYNGFAITTAVLDQLGLNIVDARITPTGDGFSLDLYHVLEEDGAPIADSERIGEIERALWRALQHPTKRRSRSRAACRARRACSAPPRRSRVTVDERNRRSVLELIAGDRPGLLCDVGKVLDGRARRPAGRQDHDRRRARRGRVLSGLARRSRRSTKPRPRACSSACPARLDRRAAA